MSSAEGHPDVRGGSSCPVWMEELREWNLFSLEKGRFWGNLVAFCSAYKEVIEKVDPVRGRRMRGKRLQLKQEGQTGCKEKFFLCEDSQAEEEADPGKAVLSSALEIFNI